MYKSYGVQMVCLLCSLMGSSGYIFSGSPAAHLSLWMSLYGCCKLVLVYVTISDLNVLGCGMVLEVNCSWII